MKVYAHDWECYMELDGAWNKEEILSIQYPLTLDLCLVAMDWDFTPNMALTHMRITDRSLQSKLAGLANKFRADPGSRSVISADLGKIRTASKEIFPGVIFEIATSIDCGMIHYYTFDVIGTGALQPPNHLPNYLQQEWKKQPRQTVGFCVVDGKFVCMGIEGYSYAITQYSPSQLISANNYFLSQFNIFPPVLTTQNPKTQITTYSPKLGRKKRSRE